MKSVVMLTMLALALALRAEDAAPVPPMPAPPVPVPPVRVPLDGDPPAPAKTAKPVVARFAPHDVEVRLKDGSAVRGELKSIEPIVLKTSFGALKFPIEDIYQITHSQSGATADPARIAAAIKDFKGADRDKQRAAENLLDNAGDAGLDALFDLRGAAPAELKPRVDALLKRVLARKDPAGGGGGGLDGVRTAKFEARGALQIESLKIASRLGDLTVKLSDVESIRWLAQGIQKSVDLDGETAMRDWFDSGVDVNLGESMSVSAVGHAVLFGSVQSTPAGNPQNQDGAFAIGTLIGRIGGEGESFGIGDSKSWKPESSGRLYLRIYAGDDVLQNNQNRSRGRYTVHISSGPWSENGAAATGDGE